MIEFTQAEIDYLESQRLARVATASRRNVPDVAVVLFKFYPDQGTFLFGGLALEETIKYANITANGNVALVVDDVETWEPYTPRGIKIRGIGEIITQTEDEMVMRAGVPGIRVTPHRKWVWGVNQKAFSESMEFVLEHDRG